MAIRNGTSGADSLNGTVDSDEINGFGGADTLFGGGGDDEITGGTGNDSLIGGDGDDIFYISGNDFGFDKYLGGDGNDEVRLSDDVTVSKLTLNSTNIASLEELNFSYYTISGTGANDVFNIRGITSVINYRTFEMGAGNDKFLGYHGTDYVNGGSGKDTLDSGDGDDEIIGGSGDDSLIGGTGDDIFYIGGNDFGFDKYLGGDGNDEVRLSDDVTVSKLTLNSTNIASLEELNFSYYTISGTGANDVFHIGGITSVTNYRTVDMGAGNDKFIGYRGSDAVFGASGKDTLDGGNGDDDIEGGSGDDSLIGGDGDDTFYISGNDFGFDKYLGGNGNDEVRLSDDVTVSKLTLNSTNIASLEELNFSYYTISGTGANDVFHIGGITSVTNYRTINLQAGNDKFTGYFGTDYVNGGSGNDTLDGGGVTCPFFQGHS